MIPEFQNDDEWFMQDDASLHWDPHVREWLDAKFTGMWLGCRSAISWPARSPVLTPMDFWLWGYLKRRVFSHGRPATPELKSRIRAEIANVSEETL